MFSPANTRCCLLVALVGQMLCIGGSGYAGQAAELFDQARVKKMVADSDYIFWGTVELASYGCRASGPFYEVELQVVEPLLGAPPDGYLYATVNGVPGRTDCRAPVVSCNPEEFEPGREYLFFVIRPYRQRPDNYIADLVVPNGAVLCAGGDRKDLGFCGAAYAFSVADPYSEILAQIDSQSPEALYREAETVLRVDGLELHQGKGSESVNVLGRRDEASANVLEVLKGTCNADVIRFRHDQDDCVNSHSALVFDHEAILFLKRSGNGYVLVGNNRGYYALTGAGTVSGRGAYIDIEFETGRLVREARD